MTKVDWKKMLLVGQMETPIGDLIEFALDNSQAGSLDALKLKRQIKAKLFDGEVLTTDEIALIEKSALQTLKDGATIALLEILAPNDLQ